MVALTTINRRHKTETSQNLRGWGQKVKIQLIQKMIMLLIKIKGMTLQQHGSKYFVHRPPQYMLQMVALTTINRSHKAERSRNLRGWGQKVKIQRFPIMVMLLIKLKGMTLQQHGSNYFVHRSAQYMLQMVALTTINRMHKAERSRNLRGWGQKVKIQRFPIMVMLLIKLKGMTLQQHGSKYFVHRSPQYMLQMVALTTIDRRHKAERSRNLRGWGQKVKIQRFPIMVMLLIKLKGMTLQQHGSKYFVHRPPQYMLQMVALTTIKRRHKTERSRNLRGWGQKVKIQRFPNIIMLLIKLKGMTLQQHGSKYFVHRPPQYMLQMVALTTINRRHKTERSPNLRGWGQKDQ